MLLATYIQQHRTAISAEWSALGRNFNIAARVNPSELNEHIAAILDFIVADIQENQTEAQRIQKAHHSIDDPRNAAQNLAIWRLSRGYTLQEMISEYRALRASVTKLWLDQLGAPRANDLLDLSRFNEAVDQLLTSSIAHYTKKLDEARSILIGILGHDLRAPIGAIHMSCQLLERLGSLNEKQSQLIQQMLLSALRANEITGNLLDLTLARLGTGLPVSPKPMDLQAIAQQLVDELNAAHPNRDIQLEVTGDPHGSWDALRVGQILSNLLGNALQYGLLTAPIHVCVDGLQQHEVSLSVQNKGIPIPPALTARIFESFSRVDSAMGSGKNLGLGLYITKEIVASHYGTIELISNALLTKFTVRLPRNAACHAH